ncbi:unnamed protein product [Gadus morhua 'NCC']
MPGPAPTPTVPVAETPGPAPLPTGPIADLPSPDPAPLAPGPVVDSQIPGPSGAGAQGAFNWREKRFFLTSQRQPTSEADEDRGIAASLEDATEEDAAEEGAEIAASLEDAEIAASLEDAAEDNAEIAASLEDAAEEDAHQTAGLQHLKPASQPERSSGKRKAKSHGGQAGAKTGRRTCSLERSGALSENESEIDFNEYQEVTMDNVQQPVGESVDFPGKFVRKGITKLGDLLDHENGRWKLALEVSAQTGLRSLRLVADLLEFSASIPGRNSRCKQKCQLETGRTDKMLNVGLVPVVVCPVCDG